MYHPAAALRATQVKESFIQDFNKITKIIAWIDETSGSEEFKETVKKALL